MKKLIAILLAALFVVALAACGSKTAEAPAPVAAPAATEAPKEEQKTETYTSSQGTVDGYDPNQKSDFPMNTSEEVRIFNIGQVDASLFEAPVLVTSFGQSADTSMMDAIMKRSGVKDYAYNALAADTDVKNYKTIIIVCGASSKGLGAAGISEADETARAEKFMAAVKESSPAVIMAHLGGSMRRGTLSDKLTDMVLEVAKYMVVVEDANFDGKFTQFAQEKNIPLTYLYSVKDGMDVFPALFN